MTKFSIILPCFNADATIGDTLASLMVQTFSDWEAIIVDDGSTDGTLSVAHDAACTDPRIRIVWNTGKGPSDARNMGVSHCARGNFIAFCDADDQWVPTKLEQLSTAFSDRSIDAVYGRIGFFRDTPSDAKVFSTMPAGDLTIDMLLGENPVCTMSNMALRRSVFGRTGGFDPSMVHNEDLEWLIRLVGQGARVVGVDEMQTWYRTSPHGLSADLAAMQAARLRAMVSAAAFGVEPSRRSHAIHNRYLARRALRTGAGSTEALRFALAGIRHSPAGFLSPFRRGALTLAGACAATVLPRAVRQSLFS